MGGKGENSTYITWIQTIEMLLDYSGNFLFVQASLCPQKISSLLKIALKNGIFSF